MTALDREVAWFCVDYIHTDIPPDMTINEYRLSRRGTVKRRWLRRIVARMRRHA